MSTDFDYQSVPFEFIHCFNGTCKRAETCLRRQVALRIPAERRYVNVINPGNIQPDGEDCVSYKEDKKVRFAFGMTHIFDRISYRDAYEIKRLLYDYFGKNKYYRMRNKTRPITVEEQIYIKKVFRNYGIADEPSFDEYREDYEW